MRKNLLKKFITVSAIAIIALAQIKPVRATEYLGTRAETCPPHRVLPVDSRYIETSYVGDYHSITVGGAIVKCYITNVYDNYQVTYLCTKCKVYTYVDNEFKFVGQYHSINH